MESLSTQVIRNLRFLTLLLLTCLLGGCVDDRSPECRVFLKLAPPDQQAEFERHPLSQQIDLSVCALKEEPPDLAFAINISDRGPEAIPLLRDKIRSTKKEVEQHDLIYIFELISRKGHLRGNPEVIVELREVVEAMRIAPVKEDATEILKKIQINSGTKSLTYAK